MKYILTESQLKRLIERGPNGPAYRGPEGYDDSCDCYVDEEVKEGLHDTSWENEKGEKITLIDLLQATENIPVQKVPLDWIKDHLLSWDGDEEEVKKIERADLKYPILIFVNDDGKFISIIDGHHRAQKAVRNGMETIKGKIIPINSLPKNIRKVFSHF